MPEKIMAAFQKAADQLTQQPEGTLIRLISHYDADGISAGAILATALYRAGYNFHLSLMRNPFTKGLDRLKKQKHHFLIFSDMGSGQIDTIKELNTPTIILDHHQPLTKKTPKTITQINANHYDIDGNYDACGATLSYGLAIALDSQNEDLCQLALAGAIGDKQHIGGITGYNKTILKTALQKHYITTKTRIKLTHDTIAESLYYSIDPYYKSVSGNKKNITRLLKQLNLPTDIKTNDLTDEQLKKLQSALFFHLIQTGCPINILDITIRERFQSKDLHCELERFADLLDACGKNHHRGLGLALCLAPQQTLQQAQEVEQEYKTKLLTALHQLEKNGCAETQHIRYFESKSSSLGGVIASIAINYLLDEQKPLFSLTKKDNEIQISCRGNQTLVKNGLDLGSAMRAITKEIGGHGGGHKIAAGATIQAQHEQEFLKNVDTHIQKQLKGTS